MKHKHYALAALVAWLLVTGWMASMVVAKPAVMRVRAQAEDTPEILQLRQQLARNQRDMTLLARFDDLPYASDDGQPLVALAPPPAPVASAGNVGNAGELPPDYEVSLVVSHQGRRRALVNGQYLAPGGRLENGARVLAIGPDWVRVDDPSEGVRLLRVQNPLRDAPAPAPASPVPHGGRP